MKVLLFSKLSVIIAGSIAMATICLPLYTNAQESKKDKKVQKEIQEKEESVKEDDIDIEYDRCVAKDTTCAGISNCAFTTYSKWEQRLKAEYDRLLNELTEEHKVILKESQTAWLSYKDATFKNYDVLFDKPGDQWCRIRHEGRIGVVRARALEIRRFHEALKK